MSSCSAIYCTSRVSKKIAGITFHRFPRDPKRKEMWVEAVGRKNWTPKPHSVLCSLHFEDDLFDRNPCAMRVFLSNDAVPTIFPVFGPGKKKITEKSKKQPRDSSTVTFGTDSADMLVIGADGSINKVVSNGLRSRRKKCPKSITPVAVEAFTKPGSESDRVGSEAQVTEKQSDNNSNQTPGAMSILDKMAVPSLGGKSAEDSVAGECAHDVIDVAFQNARSTNEVTKSPPKRSVSAALRFPSALKVNLVCPHCQKVCKVCLDLKQPMVPRAAVPHPPQVVSPKRSDDKATKALVARLKQKVQSLEQNKLWMRKKMKVLQQSVRRLTARNASLRESVKGVFKNKDNELVVIGSINGVLDDVDT